MLREAHEGGCAEHAGARSLARKVIREGFYWPTLKADAIELVRKCHVFQKHGPFIHVPAADMISVSSPYPFAQWGIDIVGLFVKTTGQRRFLVVAVDYFTKWVEAEPLTRITEGEMLKFLWKSICCRFGLPRLLVSDNGTQFKGSKITEWCAHMRIKQQFMAVAHPQANGQVEVINRVIVEGLKKRVEQEGINWVEELPSILWAYRTTPRSTTQETPYSLAFGAEAVVPAEVQGQSLRICHFDQAYNKQLMRTDLTFAEETREQARIRVKRYQQRIREAFNGRVQKRGFMAGYWVWKQADALKDKGKMEATWEGPYKIHSVFPGGSYYLMDDNGKTLPRPWNVCHLKTCYT